MRPQNSSWLRSVFPIVMALLVMVVCSAVAPAQDLNLAGLDALEASRPLQAAPVAPLDLSALDRLAAPLTAAHGLQLAGLQELEHVAPQSPPAAQLVLPAATRPPAAVPATTASPAHGRAGVVCVGGQCFSSASAMTPKQWRQWKKSQH